MPDGKKKKAFAEQLAHEMARNKDAITEIFNRSKVGKCGGMCKGFKEDDPHNLCEYCFRALEEESEEICSVSPKLRLLGDAMNNKTSEVLYGTFYDRH